MMIKSNYTQESKVKKACGHVDDQRPNDFEILRGTQLLSRDRKNQS